MDPSAGNAGAATGIAAFGLVWFLFWLAVVIVLIAAQWKVFEKAGQPGWACLVPIYHGMVMAEIAGKPSWWGLLLLIPGVNIAILIILSLGIAEEFGVGAGFGVGLILLPLIFYPILGFGSAQYQSYNNTTRATRIV